MLFRVVQSSLYLHRSDGLYSLRSYLELTVKPYGADASVEVLPCSELFKEFGR